MLGAIAGVATIVLNDTTGGYAGLLMLIVPAGVAAYAWRRGSGSREVLGLAGIAFLVAMGSMVVALVFVVLASGVAG